MPKNTQLPNFTVNLQADALSQQLNNGYLRGYTTPEPATGDTALGSQVMLFEVRFAATAAPAAVGGLITFNALTSATAAATGTLVFYRAFKSDGTTVVMQGNVGTTDQNMVLATTSIVAGANVAITSFTHDVANSTSGL